MEVAGLALAVYPALTLAFQQFKLGSKYCKNWIRFRRRYEDFIHDIGGQQILFEGVLQDLLCGGPEPFLTGVKSKDAFLKIVRDNSYTGWCDPRLKRILINRLSDEKYRWCIYQIQRVYRILEELQGLLDIQELRESNRTPDWWRLQWQRITKTLLDGHYDDHKEAKRIVSELKEMVETCHGHQYTQDDKLSLVPFFKKVRNNAQSLHEVLRNGWNCCCTSKHKAMLQLERRFDRRESEFNILLVIPEAPESNKVVSYIQQEAYIRISGEVEGAKQTDVTEVTTHEVLLPNSGASFLSDDARTSSDMRSTTSSPCENMAGEIPSRKPGGAGWKRIRNIRDKFLPRQNKPLSKEKLKTRRQFAIPESAVQDNELALALNSITWEPENLTSHVRAYSEPQIRLAAAGVIQNLCQVIKNLTGLDMGYLIDQSNNRHHFSAKKRVCSVPVCDNTVTLKELLGGDPRRFPPLKRAIVATILASSLPQLQGTHWLKDNWTKNDIIFMVADNKSIVYERPFFSKDFISRKSPSSMLSLSETSLSNSNLAICLQCLAIVLIELCFGQPIESGRDKVFLEPSSTNEKATHQFHLAIAHEWSWEEINAYDPLFSDAVHSCLYFPGIERVRNGQGDQVLQDIYSLIVQPLYDKAKSKWPSEVS